MLQLHKIRGNVLLILALQNQTQNQIKESPQRRKGRRDGKIRIEM